MSYIENVAKNFAIEMTRPRKYNYSQDILQDFLAGNPEVQCKTFKIRNSRDQMLETMLISRSSTQTCIIYAHGLGSNKLQVLPIVKYFKKFNFDICSFDFSSSGRSEGSFTSYGLREQQDVTAILSYLDMSNRYQKYILWGRSMGAVAIILNQGKIPNKKIQCIVLDSPFSSFQKIAVELASKKSFIPQFMLQIMIEPLKSYFQAHHPVNPFQIDVGERIKRIQSKIMIIYSKNDTVVSCSHAKTLSKICKRNPLQVEIKQDHNMQRSKSTHKKILYFIEDCIEEHEKRAVIMSRTKNRGISLTSKDEKLKEMPRGKSMRNTNSKITLTSSLCERSSVLNISNSPYSYSFTNKNTKLTIPSKTTQTAMNDSFKSDKWKQIDSSPTKKALWINSICLENPVLANYNKQNMKPTLNMLRKNRFR